jgi:hypothetical protein
LGLVRIERVNSKKNPGLSPKLFSDKRFPSKRKWQVLGEDTKAAGWLRVQGEGEGKTIGWVDEQLRQMAV